LRILHDVGVLTRRITTIATAIMLAMTVSVFAITAHTTFGKELVVLDSEQSLTPIEDDAGNIHAIDTQVSSLRITQSTGDGGLKVECEGNLKCEIIGDDTVVATSNNTTTSTITSSITTGINQSNIIQFGNDSVLDQQDLNTRIEGMVDRLLDEILGDLQTQLNTLSLSI
jgi:hypothetical protein